MKVFRYSIVALWLVISVDCGSSTSPAPAPTLVPPVTVLPPTAPASTYTLSGLLSDGTSGGILPGITVAVLNGPSTKTDSSGHYGFSGFAAGSYSLMFSAGGYVSQVASLTIGTANVALNIVLQRTPAAPPPPPSPTQPPPPPAGATTGILRVILDIPTCAAYSQQGVTFDFSVDGIIRGTLYPIPGRNYGDFTVSIGQHTVAILTGRLGTIGPTIAYVPAEGTSVTAVCPH
jgi:hypothetical protein